ncbi:nucleolar protein 12-like [Penaeus japonicus]|uniref:nucleolar protein 12-like n=1 Tax=Penaeus japonicus TaxID=27405 RepID=UPI001C70ED0D|nr:nucleolar protein 12-like [Penaeus japonicus]
MAPNNTGGPNNHMKKKGKSMKAVNRQTKVHIKFDAKDRRKYLKGFHKRKEERRKVAKKEMEAAMKKEKRDMRKDRRELLEKLISYNEQMLLIGKDNEAEEREEEEEKVTVTTCGNATVEISSMNLDTTNLFRSPLEADKKNQAKSAKGTTTESEDDDGSKAPKEEEEDDSTPQERLVELGVFSQKDLNKSIKRTAFRSQQKSRLMQQKEKAYARQQKKKQAKVRAKAKAKMERPNKNKGRRHCRK